MILLFARDPGAANCVIPVYRLLVERGCEATLAGKDFALKKYQEAGLEGIEIKKSPKEFLEEGKYDLVVTGVESTDFTDRMMWKVSKELGIKTLCIIDQWLNYESRFTFDKPGEVKENSERIYPDVICTIDEFAREEMVKKGIPADHIVVTGQPYFETLIERDAAIKEEQKEKIRENLGIKKEDFLITFASEPIIESYSDPMYWGYNQLTILENIINVLKKINNKSVVLVVRLHPRNKKELFQNIKVILEDKLSSQELIAVSNLVLGMSSMFILEAAIVGKPYASVQIGLNKEDPFILSRRGVSKTILRDTELMVSLERFIRGERKEEDKFEVIKNASERILREIEKIL